MANPYETPSSDPTRPETGEIDTTSPLSPKGRFARLSYIAWYMVITIISYIVMFAVGGAFMMTATDPNQIMEFFSSAGGILYIVVSIAVTIIFVIFSIRRLHDLNKTGWLMLLILIPLINIIFMLYLLIAKGDEGTNRFGGYRPTPTWERILGYIGIGVFVLALVGIVFAIIGGVATQM